MRNKLAAIFFAMVGLLAVSVPLFAHHGYAAYDTDRKVTLKGTVTRWIWSNPHCMVQLDVADESGHVAHWIAETENPSAMIRIGWTDKSIKVGDQITLTWRCRSKVAPPLGESSTSCSRMAKPCRAA